MGHRAKVLTVSDGVVGGYREDRSGHILVEVLTEHGFDVSERAVVADGVDSVGPALRQMADDFTGLIVTTGGTGFGPRDLTPEATRQVIEREAPGFAERMRAANPLGALSRGVVGTRGRALIVNVPGSPAGARESFLALADLLDHALRLLAGQDDSHPHS